MRQLLLSGLAAGLVGCGPPADGGFRFWQESKVGETETRRVEARSDGRVIDAADVLSPAEEQRIDRLAFEIGSATGRKVLVLTVPPLGNQSLEQFGWAVGGQSKAGSTVLLMVRPDDRRVRVESGGAVPPEQAARIASSMQPSLAAAKTAAAIEAGLGTYASLARGAA